MTAAEALAAHAWAPGRVPGVSLAPGVEQVSGRLPPLSSRAILWPGAVNGLHVQGVADVEGESSCAQRSASQHQPSALAADDDFLAERPEGAEESVCIGGASGVTDE